MFFDYAAIKRDVPIELALVWLKVKFHKEAEGYRASCPTCGGDERTLAINPNKNVFHCKKADKGGSILDFVMHVNGGTVKDAAQFLLDRSAIKAEKEKKTAPQKTEKGTSTDVFQPLSHLIFDHDLVQDLGISATDAEALGIGYTSKGLLKGHVCVPVRLTDGSLAGYVGIHEGKVPSSWHYPKTNVVPITKAKKRA